MANYKKDAIEHSCFTKFLPTLIEKNIVKIKKCKILDLLRSPELYKSEGASPALILSGELRYSTKKEDLVKILKYELPVIVKMFPKYGPVWEGKDNSVDVEIEIYKKIINTLLSHHFTPNLVGYIGSFTCNNFEKYLKENFNSPEYKKFVSGVEQQIKRKGGKYGWNLIQ